MGTKGAQCAGCNTRGIAWCKNCQNRAVRINPPFCKRCGYPSARSICKWCRYQTPWFDSARSWARYSGELRATVLHLKTQENTQLALALAAHLAEILSPNWAIDLVVPIPLSETRLRMRGFNQADLLADALAHFAQLPVAVRALVRFRDTQFQKMLSRAEREQNVKRAFMADKKSFAGMKTLVVDDIFVTGATINSASRAIKKAGGQSVFAITVARSLLNVPA